VCVCVCVYLFVCLSTHDNNDDDDVYLLTIVTSLTAVTRSTYAYVVVENWDTLTFITTRVRETHVDICTHNMPLYLATRIRIRIHSRDAPIV